MQTMAELLEELGMLGGSFFFFRTANKRNEKTYLITTLAYQLSLIVPHFDDYIAAKIDRDPAVFSRALAVQMKELITDPMSAAARHDSHSSAWCYTMLVDGLDECSPPESQCEIFTLSVQFCFISFPLHYRKSSRIYHSGHLLFSNNYKTSAITCFRQHIQSKMRTYTYF